MTDDQITTQEYAMSEVVSTLEQIDTEYPAIKLSDGSVWHIEKGVSYAMLVQWAPGEAVRIERNERDGFTHNVINLDSPNGTVTIRAKQIEEWPRLAREGATD